MKLRTGYKFALGFGALAYLNTLPIIDGMGIVSIVLGVVSGHIGLVTYLTPQSNY